MCCMGSSSSPLQPRIHPHAAFPPSMLPQGTVPRAKLGSRLPASLSLRMGSLWQQYSGAVLVASGTMATFGMW